MLLNYNNGLYIWKEGFALAQAQQVGACWWPAVVSTCEQCYFGNNATFWPDSSDQTTTQRLIFVAACSLSSVKCVGALKTTWDIFRTICYRDRHAQRKPPILFERKSNLMSAQVCSSILKTAAHGLCA